MRYYGKGYFLKMGKRLKYQCAVIMYAALYLFCSGCVPRDNPYDPANPDFLMPQFSCVIHFYDELTRSGVEQVSIVYSYGNYSDTVAVDSGTSILLRIEDNVAGEKIAVRIHNITSPTHRLDESFFLTLSKDSRDTIILLHNRSAQAVSWDLTGTYSDSSGIRLMWHTCNAELFAYYQIIRKHQISKVVKTVVEKVNHLDTLFLDRTVAENEIYTYWVNVVSRDAISRSGIEMTITASNRPPLPSAIDSIKADYFKCLRIYWTKNTNNDFKCYTLYRGSDSISLKPVFITTEQNLTDWLDTSIDEAARRYFYRLVTIDEGGLFSESGIASGVNITTIQRSLAYVNEGAFVMGRSGAGVPLNQQPAHSVYISSFFMDRYEVTVGRYAMFLNSGNSAYYNDSMEGIGISRNGSLFMVDSSRENHPVTWLSWGDADTFCKWSKGHLPTEAQWEKAARGTDGVIYPWGNNFYFRQSAPDFFLANYIVGYVSADDSGYLYDGARFTAPVGNYASGASIWGIYDLAGNVSEWCSDWYSNNFTSDTVDPTGAQLGLWRSYRGGSFKNYPEELMGTYRFRFDPSGRRNDLGCRCVYDEQ